MLSWEARAARGVCAWEGGRPAELGAGEGVLPREGGAELPGWCRRACPPPQDCGKGSASFSSGAGPGICGAWNCSLLQGCQEVGGAGVSGEGDQAGWEPAHRSLLPPPPSPPPHTHPAFLEQLGVARGSWGTEQSPWGGPGCRGQGLFLSAAQDRNAVSFLSLTLRTPQAGSLQVWLESGSLGSEP